MIPQEFFILYEKEQLPSSRMEDLNHPLDQMAQRVYIQGKKRRPNEEQQFGYFDTETGFYPAVRKMNARDWGVWRQGNGLWEEKNPVSPLRECEACGRIGGYGHVVRRTIPLGLNINKPKLRGHFNGDLKWYLCTQCGQRARDDIKALNQLGKIESSIKNLNKAIYHVKRNRNDRAASQDAR